MQHNISKISIYSPILQITSSDPMDQKNHRQRLEESSQPDMGDELEQRVGRLAQGNKYGVRSMDTTDFIDHHEVPSDRQVTYVTYVIDHRPLKEEKFRVRIPVEGDRLKYLGDTGSPAANLLETKILRNSVILDAKKGARFLSADIKDYFLATPMARAEYMKDNNMDSTKK